MVTTVTSKLGLLVDPNGESNISVQQSAWKKVDSAAGVLPTTKGKAIPDSTLYPGALCAETDTGISWRAIPVGDGTYTKQYINYPYHYCAYDTNGKAVNATDTSWGWDTISTGQSVNWNASDKGSGNNAWKAPIKALYSIQMGATFYTATTSGLRRHSWSLNNVLQTSYNDMTIALADEYIGLIVAFDIVLNPGDYLRPVLWQNTGFSLNFDCYIYAGLVRPVV